MINSFILLTYVFNDPPLGDLQEYIDNKIINQSYISFYLASL